MGQTHPNSVDNRTETDQRHPSKKIRHTSVLTPRNTGLCCVCLSAVVLYLHVGSIPTSDLPGKYFYPAMKAASGAMIRPTDTDPACLSLFQKINIKGEGNKTLLFHSQGCRLRKVTLPAAQECVKPRTHIAFVGDSRIRQLYAYVDAFFSSTPLILEKFHEDVRVDLDNITIEIRWQACCDESMRRIFQSWLKQTPAERPDVIIAGVGAHDIHDSGGSSEGALYYRNNLTLAVPYLQKLGEHSSVFWVPQDVVDDLSKCKRKKCVTNKEVYMYNQIAKEVLEPNGIVIWWTSFQTGLHFTSFRKDPIHMKSIVDRYKFNILQNWFCNRNRRSPNPGKCCGL